MTMFDTSLEGIQSLRFEQARRLQESVVASCFIVEAVILSMSPLFFFDDRPGMGFAWIGMSSSMVLVVYAYSKLVYREPISERDYQPYLRGHIMISCVTGTLWGGFAMYQLEVNSIVSMYTATMITITITLGGMFPSSAYRATFIGLSTCCVLPVGVYWFIFLPNPVSYFAIGFLVYYTFGLMASARTEINMRDLVLANQASSLNEQLQAQNKMVEQANTEKTRFIVATVHDFSQPLHAQGYFIHALRNLLADQKQRDLLDRIEASWRSQNELLQGISDISRIDGGFIEPRKTDVDVAILVDETASEFRADAQQNAIELKLDLQSVMVHTDPALLVRILRNLLSNAFRNTPTNGVVTVETFTDEHGVAVSISDTGSGIAEEDQARIFDEYVQLENIQRDRTQGLGLGLTIVQRLTDLLDIELQLESEPGRGASFILRIPIAEKQNPVEHERIPESISADGNLTTFIVDDEIDIRDGMSALLKSWGHKVTSAQSSREALFKLGELSSIPDILIVDNRLAAGDCRGVELIEQLRDEVNLDLPAILMTGDIEDLGDLSSRSILLLNKPVDPDVLKTTIYESRRASG